MKQPAVYILANKPYGTLYTGVTSNLVQRIYQHKNNITKGFANKYSCKLLVYYEAHADMYAAINREKQIKAGSRVKKIQLINSMNIFWEDLFPQIGS